MVEKNKTLIDFLLENLEQMYDYVIIEDGFEVGKGSAVRLYTDMNGDFMASKEVVSVMPSFSFDEDGLVEVEIEDVKGEDDTQGWY